MRNYNKLYLDTARLIIDFFVYSVGKTGLYTMIIWFIGLLTVLGLITNTLLHIGLMGS